MVSPDLHNVYLFLGFFVPLVLIRLTSDGGIWLGSGCALVMFGLLAGRVLARGRDLYKHRPDAWRRYVLGNVIFNLIAALSVFALFAIH